MLTRLALFACILVGLTMVTRPVVVQRAGPIPPARLVKMKIVDPRPWEAIPMNIVNGVGQGTCEMSIIDTTKFHPQIQEPVAGAESVRKGLLLTPHKIGRELPEGAANDLVAVEEVNDSRSQTQAMFTGITSTGWDPPDCTLAVGPNHVIATVNSSIAFFSKAGAKTFQVSLDSAGSPGFFEPVGASNFGFDPKVMYDPHSERFVVLTLEEYDASSTSYVDIAISDDSDPNGVWYKYRTSSVVTVGGVNYWVDYPGLGSDANGIYVTGNLFGFVDGFAGGWVRSFNKTPLLTGGTAVYADLVLSTAVSPQVATAWPDNRALIVNRVSNSVLSLSAINNPFTTPSIISKTLVVPSAPAPPDAGAKGTTAVLDTLDGRIMNAVVRDSTLYTCHAVSGSTRALARWYQINLNGWPTTTTVSPTLAMSGSIAPTSTTESTFFPAINVNARGDVALVHAASSTLIFPSVRAATRHATDAAGTMGEPIALGNGVSSPSGTGVKRWGDYFGCVVDPVNDCTFWGIGELRSATAWSTVISSFTIAPLADIDQDGSVNSGDLSLMLLSFGECACCPEDLDESGSVDGGDIAILPLDM